MGPSLEYLITEKPKPGAACSNITGTSCKTTAEDSGDDLTG